MMVHCNVFAVTVVTNPALCCIPVHHLLTALVPQECCTLEVLPTAEAGKGTR